MTTPTVTLSQFRADMPAFADSSVVDDPTILFWLNFADLALDANRWGAWLPMGIKMFVAHNAAVDAEAGMEAARGLPPGFSKGVINNESVDKASAGYDTTSVLDPKAGHWNLTIYGQRYYRMVQMIGAGPVHIGGDGGIMVSAEDYSTPYWGFGSAGPQYR